MFRSGQLGTIQGQGGLATWNLQQHVFLKGCTGSNVHNEKQQSTYHRHWPLYNSIQISTINQMYHKCADRGGLLEDLILLLK